MNVDVDAHLPRIALWGRVLGVILIVSGAFSAISGVFAFVIGAIPGIITVVLGVFLFQSGSAAKQLEDSGDPAELNNILIHFGRYLLWNSIMAIIAIAFVIIMVILVIMGIFTTGLTLQGF
ncbi:DUF5362 family protein [Geomicrobium sp. JCM 19055]|uniref:DUF5362 family protein n=1 Tax=Geomicrobium sp. JCM 19055 TaxID=1460649 RepID=UPI00045EDD0F|nr:DUF5362 family protein [Geomicrobium sp. JCM 19055]GAJ98151.1 hypothetical protein JCM19055_1056 [Geomicrobium sp. JCM 19055]